MFNFLGKFETLHHDFQKLQRALDLPSLRVINQSQQGKPWQEYYTLRIAQKVYKKYKKDFIHFGYEDEYKKLLTYMKGKS